MFIEWGSMPGEPVSGHWKIGHNACAASGPGNLKVFTMCSNYLSSLCDLTGQVHCGHSTTVERQSGASDSWLWQKGHEAARSHLGT